MSLEEVIDKYSLDAEILRFAEPVRTTSESVSVLGISAEQIVKSILLILDEKKPLLCLLRGSDKIDFNKVKKLYGVKNVRTATAEEVLRYTGYPVGAVPPLVEGIEAIADRKIKDYADVYAGGGDTRSLLRISTKDLLRFAKLKILARNHKTY